MRYRLLSGAAVGSSSPPDPAGRSTGRSQSWRRTSYDGSLMISIVMPAHNEEGYLEPALKSVVAGLRDRGVGFEVVVVENGSTDGTGADAELLADTYPEVSVVRLPAADYGLALKAGFLAASGDVVVNFDVDFVDLGFFDRAVEIIADGQAAIVVGSKRRAGLRRSARPRPPGGDRGVLRGPAPRIPASGERYPRRQGPAPRSAPAAGAGQPVRRGHLRHRVDHSGRESRARGA